MVKVVAGPVQPLAAAVTLTVVVTGKFVVFVAVNAGIFPVPLVPKPTFKVLVHV